jgi:hypothetical protein
MWESEASPPRKNAALAMVGRPPAEGVAAVVRDGGRRRLLAMLSPAEIELMLAADRHFRIPRTVLRSEANEPLYPPPVHCGRAGSGNG